MRILKKSFGRLKSGEEVIKYSLINRNNFTVNILNYGGIITEIFMPDEEGNFENIVLGFDNLRDYEEKSPYFGSIVGRVAGRISNAKFRIAENEYNLTKNNGKHHLHGGNIGLDKVIWQVEEIFEEECIGLSMSYLSRDGEEGYPGNLNIEISYLLNSNNELEIQQRAISDKKTIVNMTNHTYFNLCGNLKEDILNHTLTINGDQVAFVDREIIPTGELRNIENSVFDFRKGKKIGKDLYRKDDQLIKCKGFDHPFVLNHARKFAAKLEDEKSGRVMEVRTDQPVVVLYTGNYIGQELMLNGKIKSKDYMGVCLETQDYPDAINQHNFPTRIYDAGEIYKAYTQFKFYTK